MGGGGGGDEGLGRNASTPTLPPVSGAAGAPPQNARQAQRARMMARRPKEAPERQAFLAGLLNEDLQSLTKWHGSRPHHEQRRFLRSVDTLYKSFVQQPSSGPSRAQLQAQANAQAQAQAAAMEAHMAAAARASEEDPLNGPPRSPRENRAVLAGSASAPSLPSRPIEVFEQRKRDAMHTGRDDLENLNSLERWLEAGSVVTATTGTTNASRFTSLSQKTKTSSGGSSICSELGTTMQASYRVHRRAGALNRPDKGLVDQHTAGDLKDGIPNFGFPDPERLVTTFKEQYGSKPLGEHVSKEMYESVIRNGMHPFVEQFVAGAPPEKREQFAGMVRSLQYLRTAAERQTKSVASFDYDIQENRRLWKPAETKPWMDQSQINLSRVPLGTLDQHGPSKEDAAPATSAPRPPPPRPAAPPSPCVSGLGSVPLSRLSTPLVGGRHLPMATPPQP